MNSHALTWIWSGKNKQIEATKAEITILDYFEPFQDCKEFLDEKANNLTAKGYQVINIMMVL
jgi:hypothetical protein